MQNRITRRFFIGGLASAFAAGPRRIFAAAPGAFADGKPTLSFGLLSDVHVGFAGGGKSLHPSYDTATLVQAFEWFRDHGADAVVIAGDMAHHGLAGELKEVAAAWFKVFPDDKAPDGRRVERIFVFGNHDWGTGRAKAVFADEETRKANLLSSDPGKWWREIFHEDWSPFFEKRVNGYDFVGAHWCVGDCNGTREHFTNGLAEFYAARKTPFDPSRPFFHVQHPHPRATVHGDSVWGQDDGVTSRTLASHPNAIAFSGHSHTSLTDERSIWQGGFTSVGCASLRNVSLMLPGTLSPAAGFENYKTPKKVFNECDPVKAMKLVSRMDCRQGQFVSVFQDRVVFARREFVTGAPLADDLVMPLPASESRPFEFKGRAANAKPPAFPSGTALSVRRTKGKVRGVKGKSRDADVWELSFPPAEAEKSARAGIYEVSVTGPGGFSKSFAFLAVGARFPKSDRRATETQKYFIACERVPTKELNFSVQAISCWGRRSAALAAQAG